MSFVASFPATAVTLVLALVVGVGYLVFGGAQWYVAEGAVRGRWLATSRLAAWLMRGGLPAAWGRFDRFQAVAIAAATTAAVAAVVVGENPADSALAFMGVGCVGIMAIGSMAMRRILERQKEKAAD
jgi:hypothetical protein